MPEVCNYGDCERDPDIYREFEGNWQTYGFCEDHDPLEDPNVKYRWQAVEDDDA